MDMPSPGISFAELKTPGLPLPQFRSPRPPSWASTPRPFPCMLASPGALSLASSPEHSPAALLKYTAFAMQGFYHGGLHHHWGCPPLTCPHTGLYPCWENPRDSVLTPTTMLKTRVRNPTALQTCIPNLLALWDHVPCICCSRGFFPSWGHTT